MPGDFYKSDLSGLSRAILFFGLLLVSVISPARDLSVVQPELQSLKTIEPKLITVLDKIQGEKLDDALVDVEAVIQQSPKFRLAKLVYADLMMAKAGMPERLGLINPSNEQLEGLQHEAKVRWRRYHEQLSGELVPDVLMHLSASQKTVLVADLSRSRVYLYENSATGPKLLADFYVTQGKNGMGKRLEGDKKTPLGVYFITSSLDTSKLPDLYGSGAYPIDYPNAWDRRKGYTGHGIWLHGVPSNTYSRVPKASDGCLAMSNPELDAIKPYLHAGATPVIIAEKLRWVRADELTKRRNELIMAVKSWREDWESLDTKRYLSHYAYEFKSDGKNYPTWRAHKQRVNKHKKFIRVELSDVSMLSYPGEDGMVVVSYRQKYQSDNFRGDSRKRQYWRNINGSWKIIYEGRG